MDLQNNLKTSTGWEIYEEEFAAGQLINRGSIFMVGNGYLGYRGTFAEWGKEQYQACIVSDTYDRADGKWRELCNVPNGLSVRFFIEGKEFSFFDREVKDYQRGINLKTAAYHRRFSAEIQDKKFSLAVERLADYHSKHLLAQRHCFQAEDDLELTLVIGIDAELWSLNGEHFQSYRAEHTDNDLLNFSTVTGEEEIEVEVAHSYNLNRRPKNKKLIQKERQIFKKMTFELQAGKELILENFAAIFTSNDLSCPKNRARKRAAEAAKSGYQKIRNLHSRRWSEIWQDADVEITGDLEAQALIRFNLFHNIIATPVHSDRLPIGARGLSCQAYQGAAFWDQEIFNLPMFLYTWPEVARSILKYRYHTLNGARKKARKLGYQGAYYAWISGKTGEELCPDFFFQDVLTGRKIRNHFNDWQIHVSPDIAYTVWKYFQVTGDRDFLVDYGAEIIFEVARFLYSHAYYDPTQDRYEFIRLLGPDEYHENVDNNYFTNYQAQYVLERARELYLLLKEQHPDRLKSLEDKINLRQKEAEKWGEMAAKIYLLQPDPETGLIPQFEGYFELEDTLPEVLEERLQDPEEYWGWPIGVAVHTQVIKQADLIQLFLLHEDFAAEIVRANYDYYEPRTEHGSSLSPSAYALVACQLGYREEAYDNFLKSCGVDLYNTSRAISGGTFIGGIHTAACGAAWQMAVRGFAGMKYRQNQVIFQPLLPDNWDQLSFSLIIKGNRFKIVLNRQEIKISAAAENKSRQKFSCQEEIIEVSPGENRALKL